MWDAVREWGEGRRWPRIALWALIGAFIVLVPLTLGSALLLAPVVLLVLALLLPLLQPVSLPGLVLGPGLALLLIALLNAQGPGTVCSYHAVGMSCSEYADPRPWLLAGTALVVVAIGLEAWSRRRVDRGVTETT